MTTKPKAKKFRIRRSPSFEAQEAGQAPGAGEASGPSAAASVASAAPAQPHAARQPRRLNPLEESVLDGSEDGFPERGFTTVGQAAQPKGAAPGAARGAGAAPGSAGEAPTGESQAVAGEQELAEIRKEGLTGRQLRMARRLAQKHGLPATSDYDAVRLLRRAGIDPFHRSNMLELITPENTQPQASGNGQVQLPQTTSNKPQLPTPEVMDAADRARTVQQIQADIAARRRRKLIVLAVRLAFFVLLPTLIAGYYFYNIATPMYATKSEFVIQKADSGTSPFSSFLSGSGLANSQDSITVQSYLTSRDAMLRLDRELGFKALFQDPSIDPIHRLDPNASNEAAYKVYKKNVKIGYDPTEGIIKMEVVAPSPELSEQMSKALIRYAEERVDNLTSRLRDDQMEGSVKSYEDAERKRTEAQNEVLRLQRELGVYDPTTEASTVTSQVAAFETELRQKQLQLQQLLDNARPNQARVEGVRGDIRRLEALIEELRGKLTEGGGITASGESLAQITSQLMVAQSNLETRTAMLQQALLQLETSRIEANKQTRYLEMGVHPVAPDQPTYPRGFENTLLSFLVFAGIYLMLSITGSILREQVSG